MNDFIREAQDLLVRLQWLAAKMPPAEPSRSLQDYHLNPPLTPSELKTFEARIGLRLPEDIRLFVTELGNGGAGPFNGLDVHGRYKYWMLQQGKVSEPFNPGTYLTVRKRTEAEFRQYEKDEMLRILQVYGKYIKVESPNRYQKDMKTFWGLDLAADEWVQFGPPDGCVPIYRRSNSTLYLIVNASQPYCDQVLGCPGGGEKGGRLPRMWGTFRVFYLGWLNAELRRLSWRKGF